MLMVAQLKLYNYYKQTLESILLFILAQKFQFADLQSLFYNKKIIQELTKACDLKKCITKLSKTGL